MCVFFHGKYIYFYLDYTTSTATRLPSFALGVVIGTASVPTSTGTDVVPSSDSLSSLVAGGTCTGAMLEAPRAELPPIKPEMAVSMGRGKMMVEFFSAEMLCRVCRYLCSGEKESKSSRLKGRYDPCLKRVTDGRRT